MTESRIEAFAPPLQGAHRLASLCRSAGVVHAPRNPCYTMSPETLAPPLALPLEREGTRRLFVA